MSASLAAAVVVATAVLSGCGGGESGGPSGASQPSSASAEGAYIGYLYGSSPNTVFAMLVLENGDFWSIYGVQSAGGFAVAGFVQGSSVGSNGSLSISSVKDFGFLPAVPAVASATYDAASKVVLGSFSSPQGTASLSGSAISAPYNYSQTADLANVMGSWSLGVTGGDSVSFTVSSTGTFATRSAFGCSMSGTVAPRRSGKNVYDVVVTFGSHPCILADQTMTGVGLVYSLATGQTQLLFTGVNSSRTAGYAAYGVR